ncbi:HEC/Ndc80p family-domain-containing protein [Fennellomyces sp. T-0311]|nr:HEC/Ndc80p family-domain-containing protein [Fennellomyces sp. T-0311]
MDHRRFTTGVSSRTQHGGIKRTLASGAATPSKLPRVSIATSHQPLGPRRNNQVAPKVNTASVLSSQSSSQPTEQNVQPSRRISTLNRPSFVVATATTTDRPPNIKLHTDPRPIRDPEFQKSAMRTIIRYLNDTGYGPVTVQALRGLSYRTFQQIFKFLHLRLSPRYIYPDKFEDVFIDILKRSLRYPLADTLSPKALFSIAAPHSYPSFLALLLWMVDVCKFFDIASQRYAHSMLEEEDDDPSEDSNVLFFVYSWVTYCAFLNGSNDHKEYDDRLAQLFDEGERKYNADMAREDEENRVRQAKLDQLKSQTSPRDEQLRRRKDMEKDMIKFEEYTEEKKRRIAKYTESVSKIEHEKRLLEIQCAEVEKEHDLVRKRLESMAVSPEEVERMLQEQMDLETAIVDAQTLVQKLTKEKNNAEALYSKRLAMIEQVKKTYHALLGTLDISVTDGITQLELSSNASIAEEMRSVKRAGTGRLESLKRQYEDSFNKASDLLTKAHQKLMTVENEVAEQRRKVAALSEKFEEAKEAHKASKQRFLDEIAKSNEEMAKKNRELKDMKRMAKNELYDQLRLEKNLRDM